MSIVVSIPGSALLEAYESLPGAAPQNVEFVQWDLKSPPPA